MCQGAPSIVVRHIFSVMAYKRRKQQKKITCLQDEPDQSQQTLSTTKAPTAAAPAQSYTRNRENTSFTARTQVGRRIYNGYPHQEALDIVRHFDHSHGSVPQLENEERIGNVEQEEEGGTASGAEIMEKETRGPTYMKSIWGRPPSLPPILVEYNEFGQPIDGESSKLCHFLGSIARNGKYCPIDVSNWHDMPKEKKKKKEMLEVVKLRFYVPMIAEKWILASIGLKWRNWKHSLKAKYWDDVPIEYLIHERDDRVLEGQWIKLLSYWKTEEAKKLSKRNQIARGKKIMNQRTGKTSFAQIKAKLVGAYVFIRNFFTSKIVAKGCIHATDPSTKVGGQML